MGSISRLERLVRETVEGSFGRLFGGYLEPLDVATQLVLVMEESTASAELDNDYVISLHPADHQLLLGQNPNLAQDLAEAAWKLGRRYGLALVTRPKISIVEDQSVRRHSFQIVVQEHDGKLPGLDTTQVVSRQASAHKSLATLKALDAFLIVQGKRHVALDKPLITIGRRPDNDIVLDSKTVSRQHAQVRWRFDRFILYDVSNRERTRVNGEIVSERVLQQGDVIALSDALLIYGEGEERGPAGDPGAHTDESNTLVIPPTRK